MAAKASITLDVTAERDLWCETCCLSTGVRIQVVHLRTTGVTELKRIEGCVNGPHDD